MLIWKVKSGSINLSYNVETVLYVFATNDVFWFNLKESDKNKRLDDRLNKLYNCIELLCLSSVIKRVRMRH